MTPTQTIAAVELARVGHSETQIARALAVTPAAAKQGLVDARRILEANTPLAAEKWLRAIEVGAERGDHRPAQALLTSVDVIKPPPMTYDTGGASAKAAAGVTVQFVGFGFAGLPPGTTPPPQPLPSDMITVAAADESDDTRRNDK